jgi:hypothetical protein
VVDAELEVFLGGGIGGGGEGLAEAEAEEGFGGIAGDEVAEAGEAGGVQGGK